jgi:hypothetical protein
LRGAQQCPRKQAVLRAQISAVGRHLAPRPCTLFSGGTTTQRFDVVMPGLSTIPQCWRATADHPHRLWDRGRDCDPRSDAACRSRRPVNGAPLGRHATAEPSTIPQRLWVCGAQSRPAPRRFFPKSWKDIFQKNRGMNTSVMQALLQIRLLEHSDATLSRTASAGMPATKDRRRPTSTRGRRR